MAEGPLFAGPALRRLRRREGLTQAGMAARLSISPSYLNLLERNQRPLSARVVMQIVDRFDFDPRGLREDAAIGGVDGLARRMSDDRFADLGMDRDDVAEFLASAPLAAAAFARLFDNAGDRHDLAEQPLQACRREIDRWRNHFADLDNTAEQLADELRLSRADIGAALEERLRERHQIAVRILPQDVLPNAVRRLDLHARQLQLSEMLDPAARNFQIAMQLAQLENREAITLLAAGANFEDETAHQLFEQHLTAYFAGALMMPYSRFLRACESTGYDLQILMRRFGVSVVQLANRLTTLQRVGQRGLPFFMARLDRAGQFASQIAGASGAAFLDADISCPLWIAHHAFETGDDWRAQSIHLPEVGAAPSDWVILARKDAGIVADGCTSFSIMLGLESRFAGDIAQARGLSLRAEDALRAGTGCGSCHIADCRQRSLPPRGAKLRVDTMEYGLAPYRFGDG